MAQPRSAEFRTQGLYGTSIFDHFADGLRNMLAVKDRYQLAKKLYGAGLGTMVLGYGVFLADGVTSLTAAGQEASKPASEITNPTLKDFFESRRHVEMGIMAAGAGVVAIGIAVQASEENRSRRNIFNS